MPRIFRLTLFLVVSSPLLFSQVIIREKVELAPKPSAVAVAGQLEVTLSLSGSLNPNRPAFVRASNFGCGIDVIGGTSVSAPLKAGVYQIVGRFSTAGAVSYALRVKVGSDELLVEQGVAPGNATINLVPQVGFGSGIKFSFGGPIVQGQTAGYGFIGFVSTPCSTPAVHSLLSTTLSITTGQGLGEFVDETGRLLGESVTRKLNELGGIGFIANGRSPVGSQEEVVIQATMGGGVAGTTSLVVIKKQADCSDAPPCADIEPISLITLQTHPNGFGGVEVCQKSNTLGGFAPVTGRNTIQDFSVAACFDAKLGRWKLQVPNIVFNAVQDLCYQNIERIRGELVSDISKIPVGECERAKRDFKLHENYPIGDPANPSYIVKYFIAQALLWHEEKHKSDYQKIINSLQGQWATGVASYRPTCEEISNVEDARTKGKQEIRNLLTVHWEKISTLHKLRADDPAYEQETQNSFLVQMFVREYLNNLNCQ